MNDEIEGAAVKKKGGGRTFRIPLPIDALVNAAMSLLTVVLFLGALIGTGYVVVGGDKLATIKERLSAREDEIISTRPTHVWIELDEKIFQLNENGRTRHAMIEFAVHVPIGEEASVLARMPELQFLFQTYLRELSIRDLQGSMGLYELRRACRYRARRLFGEAVIQDVLVTEILIQ